VLNCLDLDVDHSKIIGDTQIAFAVQSEENSIKVFGGEVDAG